MCGPEDPLFTPLLPLARVPFQAKELVHKTPFWENLEILALTASIFTQILAHKPPNLEIFRSQAPKFGKFPLTSPPFQRQMSVRKPHTSEIQAAHPYLKKKLSAPRGGGGEGGKEAVLFLIFLEESTNMKVLHITAISFKLWLVQPSLMKNFARSPPENHFCQNPVGQFGIRLS